MKSSSPDCFIAAVGRQKLNSSPGPPDSKRREVGQAECQLTCPLYLLVPSGVHAQQPTKSETHARTGELCAEIGVQLGLLQTFSFSHIAVWWIWKFSPLNWASLTPKWGENEVLISIYLHCLVSFY